MSKLLISIITPNFNSAVLIHETYQSICNQTHSNWEWLIIDDGSIDHSPELIQEWAEQEPRIKFHTRTHHAKGASACRNIGIEHAKGQYLIFLDADDLLEPICLKQRLQLMSQNPHLDFAVFKMGYFYSKISGTPGFVNHFNNDNNQYSKDFISYNIPWAITCPIWKREFLIKNEIRFSDKYQRLQDPEFHVKILLKYQPNFEAAKELPVDCYYRQNLNHTAAIKIQSFTNITNGFRYFINDNIRELKKIGSYQAYRNEINQFVIQSLHALLFQYRLTLKTSPLRYYNDLKAMGLPMPFSVLILRLFYALNLLRLTFIKGAGVSKLWSLITSN